MKAVNKVVRGLTAVELVACALTFAIMVICYFISVVNRNIIKGSMPWTEELAVYSMVYMALLGTELGLRDGTQVSVTALTSKLEGKTIGKILDIIARLIVIYFVFMMFRNGNACRMIKRCNDFGAGGVSVAIGELADGLEDDLIDTLFGRKKKEADNA